MSIKTAIEGPNWVSERGTTDLTLYIELVLRVLQEFLTGHGAKQAGFRAIGLHLESKLDQGPFCRSLNCVRRHESANGRIRFFHPFTPRQLLHPPNPPQGTWFITRSLKVRKISEVLDGGHPGRR